MKVFLIILVFLISFSCKNVDYTKNFTNSSILSFNLLKTSVDAAISIHPSINTRNYVVDLSKGFNLESSGRDSFIIIKEKTLPVSHEDSVLFTYDNDKLRVSRSMIITFDTIKLVDQKTVRVIARKIISSDTIVTVTLILGRHANSYFCIKCEELKP
jgi:hypothetical protein